jgi:cell division protein FtsB
MDDKEKVLNLEEENETLRAEIKRLNAENQDLFNAAEKEYLLRIGENK